MNAFTISANQILNNHLIVLIPLNCLKSIHDSINKYVSKWIIRFFLTFTVILIYLLGYLFVCFISFFAHQDNSMLRYLLMKPS